MDKVLKQKYVFNKNFQSRHKGLSLLAPEQILSIHFASKGIYKGSFYYLNEESLISENKHLPDFWPLIKFFIVKK